MGGERWASSVREWGFVHASGTRGGGVEGQEPQRL
jgi:hypothetical protein